MNLEIVMYHYVRPTGYSSFPRLKYLELNGFRRQLDYLRKNKVFVTFKQIRDAIKFNAGLPENAVWLTFDDGYIDHFEFVAPLLAEFDVKAGFFPVVESSIERKLLSVNSIQHVIASVDSGRDLLSCLKEEMLDLGFSSKDFDRLWLQTDKTSRYDTAEIKFFKNILQKELDSSIRDVLINRLFRKCAGISEYQLARELYMGEEEIKKLISQGHTVGSHTHSHPWLDTLNKPQQRDELMKSYSWLRTLDQKSDDWIICYPFGGYNDTSLKLLSEMNCFMGLTTKVGIANLNNDLQLCLPRMNTNDYPA